MKFTLCGFSRILCWFLQLLLNTCKSSSSNHCETLFPINVKQSISFLAHCYYLILYNTSEISDSCLSVYKQLVSNTKYNFSGSRENHLATLFSYNLPIHVAFQFHFINLYFLGDSLWEERVWYLIGFLSTVSVSFTPVTLSVRLCLLCSSGLDQSFKALSQLFRLYFSLKSLCDF